jgi:sialic acid synthase SpsE
MFTKSIVAKQDIEAGTVLQTDHLTFKKPGTGIPASRLNEVIGRKLVCSVAANTRLTESDLEPKS